MEYLKNKTVYLCGPLHACHDDGIGWRDYITPRLSEYGLIVEDPTKKTACGVGEVKDDKARFKKLIKEKNFADAKEQFWPIIRKDLRCVDKSDFLVFCYDTSVSTVGTIHELVVASNQKKPILLKYDENQLDSFNPWIVTFVKTHCFFSEWNDLFDYLTKINNGEFDTSYWTL